MTRPLLVAIYLIVGAAVSQAQNPANPASTTTAPQRRRIIDVNTHLATNLVRQNLENGEEPAAGTTDAVLLTTVQRMDRFGIRVTVPHSDSVSLLERWRAKEPDRFVPSLGLITRRSGRKNWPKFDAVRALLRDHKLGAIGEIYISPQLPENDPALEQYLALAEEFDVPVSFHLTGMIHPALTDKHTYAMTQPTVLQSILRRHLKLRVQIGHGGYPWLSETVALMWRAPNVYADLSLIDWLLPTEEFREYMHGLVRAGLASQLMFGTYAGGDVKADLDLTSKAIDGIEGASFLTDAEKNAIFCGNAARLYKLSDKICAM